MMTLDYESIPSQKVMIDVKGTKGTFEITPVGEITGHSDCAGGQYVLPQQLTELLYAPQLRREVQEDV